MVMAITIETNTTTTIATKWTMMNAISLKMMILMVMFTSIVMPTAITLQLGRPHNLRRLYLAL